MSHDLLVQMAYYKNMMNFLKRFTFQRQISISYIICYPPKLVSSSALFSSAKLCSGEQFVRNKAESLITKILHNL